MTQPYPNKEFESSLIYIYSITVSSPQIKKNMTTFHYNVDIPRNLIINEYQMIFWLRHLALCMLKKFYQFAYSPELLTAHSVLVGEIFFL